MAKTDKLNELGVFELAGNAGDKPLSAKDVKILKVLVGQLEKVTSQMKVMYDKADVKSINACIDNINTIKVEPAMQDFCAVMPDENYQKQVKVVVETLPKDVAEKFLGLSKKQQIDVIATSPENVSFFLDRKRYNDLEEKLVNIYGKISKDFPEVINRNQDNQAHEILAEVLNSGSRKILDDAWQSNNLEDRLEAVKTVSQMVFPKENRDYPFKMCSGGNGIAGAYDDKTDFGVVADRLLAFPDWSMSMFTTIHENQHRQQHLQTLKLEQGKLQENTAEFFQARIFKANFEGGYLVSFTKRTELEKEANYEDYVKQPVEFNANSAGFTFTKHFSASTVAQRRRSHEYGIASSQRAKSQLKIIREQDPENLTRKPTAEEYKNAGLLTLANSKRGR